MVTKNNEISTIDFTKYMNWIESKEFKGVKLKRIKFTHYPQIDIEGERKREREKFLASRHQQEREKRYVFR